MSKKQLLISGTNSCEEYEWDDLVDELTSIMLKKNPMSYWKASVKNFGWRSLDGQKEVFYADTGEKLLQAILPNCECSFKIYHNGKSGLAINNAHHDSPCWAEWYYIEKGKQEE